MTDIVQTLVALVGANGVIDDGKEMEGFCTDWFGRFTGTALAVVLPRTTEEVASVLKFCNEEGINVVPQGGNTSVCGGSVPESGRSRAIVLSLSRMRQIRSIDTFSNAIVVDAGCILEQVQHAVSEAGKIFPLSLSAEGSCQIGGTISTNAGGTNVVRYGTMRDLVLGLEVVLPDGRIWNGLKTVRKDSSGYNLTGLWVGAEGTLGVITAAALKIFPRLKETSVAWVAVTSPEAALRLLARLSDTFDTRLVAYEMMSGPLVDLVVHHIPDTREPLEQKHGWHILLELAETTDTGDLGSRLEEALGAAMEEGLVADAVVTRSEKQAQDFWRIRHAITDALKDAGASLTHDVAVPLGAVPEYISRVAEIIARDFPQALGTVVCHLGDGNVHYNLTFDRDVWNGFDDGEAMAGRIAQHIQDAAMDLGGTFVAEHGIGRKFLKAVARYKSPVEKELAYGLKQLLDPKGIMNPGRTIVKPE